MRIQFSNMLSKNIHDLLIVAIQVTGVSTITKTFPIHATSYNHTTKELAYKKEGK